jgi:hypothetical protein
MRANPSSPGVSGHKCGLCRWDLTTRDSVRQETPGGRTAGAGSKGPAEELMVEGWEGPPKAAQLNSYRRNK